MRCFVRNRHNLLKCIPLITTAYFCMLLLYGYYKDVHLRNGRFASSQAANILLSSKPSSLTRRATVNWTQCVEELDRDFSHKNASSPLWIFPTMSSVLTSSIWRAPNNWTMFVPQELSRGIICDDSSCHTEDPNDFVPIWEAWGQNASNSSRQYHQNVIHRKLASLLFVIKRGARGILFTSDLTSVPKSVSRLTHDSELGGVVGLEYFGSKLTTDSYHYHHRYINQWNTPCQYRIRKRMRPIWTIGVRCKSYRTLMTDVGSKTATLTDSQSPPVFVSDSKIDVDDVSDGYFHRSGMWAAFVSIFSSSEKTNAWVLWAQRMLQEIRGEMGLSSLLCWPGSKVKEITSLEPDKKSLEVFEFIKQWHCGKDDSFFVCAKSLANEMKTIGFVDQEDVNSLDLWIEGLKNYAGYSEPIRTNKTKFGKDIIPFCVFHSPAIVRASKVLGQPVNFFPNLYDKCNAVPASPSEPNLFSPYRVTKPMRLNDVALVVIFFSSTLYNNIPKLQDLYAKHFSTIVYCGPFEKTFRVFQRDFDTPVSFIVATPSKGYLAYECITRAMLMNYDVSGYLQIADDVLLNLWNFRHTPRNQFWWQTDVSVVDWSNDSAIDQTKFENSHGLPLMKRDPFIESQAVGDVWSVFHQIERNPKAEKEEQIIKSFKKMLRQNTQLKDGLLYASSDIFYVPSEHRQAWGLLSEIFSKHSIFLKIAVPTLMYGLAESKHIFHLSGSYLKLENRTQYLGMYKPKQHFMHPWKLSWLNYPEDAAFLCKRVLPQIANDLTFIPDSNSIRMVRNVNVDS